MSAASVTVHLESRPTFLGREWFCVFRIGGREAMRSEALEEGSARALEALLREALA